MMKLHLMWFTHSRRRLPVASTIALVFVTGCGGVMKRYQPPTTGPVAKVSIENNAPHEALGFSTYSDPADCTGYSGVLFVGPGATSEAVIHAGKGLVASITFGAARGGTLYICKFAAEFTPVANGRYLLRFDLRQGGCTLEGTDNTQVHAAPLLFVPRQAKAKWAEDGPACEPRTSDQKATMQRLPY